MHLDVGRLSIAEIKCLLNSSQEKQRKRIIALLENDRRIGAQKIVAMFTRSLQKSEEVEKEFRRLASFEERLKNKGFRAIAGVDEAGRGALAGPLVAAAIVLPDGFFLPGLRECKQLMPEAREEFYEQIMSAGCEWHVEVVKPDQIDKRGLHKANLYALEQAVLKLARTPDYVLSDGFSLSGLTLPNIGLIEGDRLSVSIAAASIIAKVERDRMMIGFSKEFPEYGFESHKGYGTKEHLSFLEEYGPSPIHRLSFKPVRERIELQLGDLQRQKMFL